MVPGAIWFLSSLASRPFSCPVPQSHCHSTENHQPGHQSADSARFTTSSVGHLCQHSQIFQTISHRHQLSLLMPCLSKEKRQSIITLIQERQSIHNISATFKVSSIHFIIYISILSIYVSPLWLV